MDDILAIFSTLKNKSSLVVTFRTYKMAWCTLEVIWIVLEKKIHLGKKSDENSKEEICAKILSRLLFEKELPIRYK